MSIKEQLVNKSLYRSNIKTRQSVDNRSKTENNNYFANSNFETTGKLTKNKSFSDIRLIGLNQSGLNNKNNYNNSKDLNNYVFSEEDENQEKECEINRKIIPEKSFLITKNNLENKKINDNYNFTEDSYNTNTKPLKSFQIEKIKSGNMEGNPFSQVNTINNLPFGKPKRKLTNREIEIKIEEFKGKLNMDLLKALQEEKYKEEEREILYKRTPDVIEKRRLEKIISMERAQSSERILQINE